MLDLETSSSEEDKIGEKLSFENINLKKIKIIVPLKPLCLFV